MKRDRNNFINIILNNINVAFHFHKRVDLNITAKIILKHIRLRFYIRRRYSQLYLYTRVLDKGFGNQKQKKKFLDDMLTLIPELKIESTQGHHKGLLLLLDKNDLSTCVKYLKYISLFAYPQDFYITNLTTGYSIKNYETTSTIPVHITIRKNVLSNLNYYDICQCIKQLKRSSNKSTDTGDIPTN